MRIILVTFMKNYTDFPPVSGKTIPLNFFSGEFAPTFMQRRRQWLCPTCLCKFRHSPSIKAAPNRHRTYRHADSAAVCDIGSPQAHLTPHGIDALLPFTARLTPGYSFNALQLITPMQPDTATASHRTVVDRLRTRNVRF